VWEENLPFSIVVDVMMSKLEMRGSISTRLRQITAYAEDILVMARTELTLIDTFVKLKEEANRYGLVVNEGRTKYMKCGRRKNNINWK
jgi:porphobilinogen deaminase